MSKDPPPIVEEARTRRLQIIKYIVGLLAAASLVLVVAALCLFAAPDDRWFWQIVVFLAVATVPQWPIQWISALAESVVTPPLARENTSPPGFGNLGAFVGVVERPLFLGALISGFPEFVAVWFVFKGVAGFRIGLDDAQLTERRLFQLFLLNSALSLAGAALGWLAWIVLGFPTSVR